MKIFNRSFRLLAGFQLCISLCTAQVNGPKPNVVMIYADDVGYGDLSCYGASKISTPSLDLIAANGLLFTRAHASSSTCTPSRYSMLTGQYAWRKEGTGIAPGNAPLIIDPAKKTIAAMFQLGGYKTGMVGKWHLGLGGPEGPDWNGKISPGPLEMGFDYSFIFPATADRVPTVFVKNHHIVGLDPSDTVAVSYKNKIGNEPTGKENPELLKMKYSHGHDQTIVNGISRIGFMSGGQAARWKDEDLADIFVGESKKFITVNKNNPFFLYFATSDIHVPRAPNSRFEGKSGMGPRGDALVQLDWTVGEVLRTLDSLGLTNNTIVLFSSDNGPVLDDGYIDQAVEKQNGHNPSGSLRGGKGSKFEAGTRIPMIIQWPEKIKAGSRTDALVSQVDLYASFASLIGQKLAQEDAPDSFPLMDAFLGKTSKGRTFLVEHSYGLALVQNDWKYIAPGEGAAVSKNTNTETGNNKMPQLYDLKKDMAEQNNLAEQHPERVKEMQQSLEKIKNNPNTRTTK